MSSRFLAQDHERVVKRELCGTVKEFSKVKEGLKNPVKIVGLAFFRRKKMIPPNFFIDA